MKLIAIGARTNQYFLNVDGQRDYVTNNGCIRYRDICFTDIPYTLYNVRFGKNLVAGGF